MPIQILARRLPLMLAVAAPFLSCWLVIGTYLVPARLEPFVLDLSGTWKLQEGEAGGEAELAHDDSGWKEIHFPGGYTAQGYHASRAWARKRFELTPALRDRPLLFTLGGLRSGRATLFVNGHTLGQTDESFRGLKGEVDGLEAWTVDSRDLHPGSNVLALRFDWTLPGDDGVADARLLLGAREQLMPYYLRASDTRRFIQNGALVLFVFMLVLLSALLGRETEPHRRALQRSTLRVVAAAAFYLAIHTGTLPPLKQSAPITFTLLVITVAGVAWAMLEFCQQFCLERVTRAGKVHRFICGAFAAAFAGAYALGPGAGLVTLYQLFAPYVFVTILYVMRLATVTLLRRRRASDLVFATSVFCMILAAILDLLTDLDVIEAPRLFTVALLNLGLCAGALLLSDFIQLSHVNETLSARLTRTNAELERALLRAEDVVRLKSALLADRLDSVGTLAIGMAHEINNPMAYVTANLGFLSRQLSRLSHSTGGEHPMGSELAELGLVAAESLEGARRVNQIVKELKLFARGGDDERWEVVDLRVVVGRSLNLARHVLEHRTRIVQELGVIPLVLGSESQLGLVCLNLLLNAGQAMTEGDAHRNELVLRTRQREDGRVLLEISDTGRGISPEDQRRLFDPFFTTKPTGEGKGLGLSICHGIVQRLGGEIQVESRVARGSLFRVILPPASAA